MRCCVPKCRNSSNLHAVPFSYESRWKKWLKICPFLHKYTLKQLENVRICEVHFLSKYIINRRLSSDAIPSLYLQLHKSQQNKLTSEKHKYLEVAPLQSRKPLDVKVIVPLATIPTHCNDVSSQPLIDNHIEQLPVHLVDSFESRTDSIEVQNTLDPLNKIEFSNQSSIVPNVDVFQSFKTVDPNISISVPCGNETLPQTTICNNKSNLGVEMYPKSSEYSPRKQKLRASNLILKRKLRAMSIRYKRVMAKSQSSSTKLKFFLDKYPLLSNFGKILIDSQLRSSGINKKKIFRYTTEEKIFALSLYKLSPKCYRFLQNHLRLPSKSTISSLLSNVPLRPGINEFMFQHLADVAKNKNEMGLQCVLIFDEMAINKNLFFNFHTGVIEGFEDLGGGVRTNNVADKVLVFMLRGLFSPWKIPIAFYFVRDGIKTLILKKILKEIIATIFQTGFVVRVTVSDQGSANVAAINSLISDTRADILRTSMTNDPNIIYYVIDNYKIYHMYDVPHLLKCFRNNFQKKDLLIAKQRAQWDCVQRLYAVDGLRGVARSTKLTDKHVNPNSYDKMKVKYAAQVFSREVSNTLMMQMKIYEDLQLDHNYALALPVNIGDGIFTAEILLFINDLFDSLNCSGYSSGNLQASLSLNSSHSEFWSKAVKKLESMEFDAKDLRERKPLCLQNFIHDIKTVKHLWSELRLIPGVKFLSLKRLNQDPLENFFSQIRGQGGSSTHPDCHHVVSLFKTLLINNITTGKSLYANCAGDSDKMLGTLSNLANRQKFVPDYSDCISDSQSLILTEHCFNSENIFQTHAVSYIAGAVCRYIFPKQDCINCQICKNTLLSNEIETFHSLIKHREYDPDKKKLYYPSQKLMSLVWHCINIIEKALPSICKIYIYTDLISEFEKLDTSWLICLDHKTDFLKAFWIFVIRMQVRQWCINFNRRIHNKDTRKKGMEMENLIATKVTKGASYRTARRKSH